MTVHVQDMECGPGVNTVAHGHFRTMAEAVTATEARPYGVGHWQGITDTETGERLVRAGGRMEWERLHPLIPPSA